MPSIPVHALLDWLSSFYGQYGYFVVLLSSLIENTVLLGFLLPGNSLVLLGAVYARLGTLNLGLVILLASLGTVLGYHIDYLLGRFVLGNITSWLNKTGLGKKARLEARLRLACRMLNKHGGKAILVSHLVGSLRSVIAMGAGVTHMRYLKFLGYEVLAAVLWNTLFAVLGYGIAMEIDRLAILVQQGGVLIFVLLVGGYLLWRRFGPEARRRARRRGRKLLRSQDMRAV